MKSSDFRVTDCRENTYMFGSVRFTSDGKGEPLGTERYRQVWSPGPWRGGSLTPDAAPGSHCHTCAHGGVLSVYT